MPTDITTPADVLSVHRFDFDNCVFHSVYMYSNDENRLITTNIRLFDMIETKVYEEKASAIDIGIASARQSFAIDKENCIDAVDPYKRRYTRGSCFPAMAILRDEIARRTMLPTQVNEFLMADITANQPVGYAFNKALAALQPGASETKEHPEAVFEDSKVSILYAQMHQIAEANPAKKIHFHFYDDRVDILKWVNDFYRNNPDLMPKNITLHLHEYSGERIISTYKPIQGSGKIDADFRDSYKEMLRHCKLDPDNVCMETCHVARDLDVVKFKKYRERVSRQENTLAGSIFSFWNNDPFYQKEWFCAALAGCVSVAGARYLYQKLSK